MAASSRLLLALWEHPHGLETTAEATHRLDNAAKANCLARRILAQCIYDIGKNTAHFGSAKIDGPALMWTLIDGTPPDGRMLDITPPDGRALDSSPPDGRALNRTPPARSADSVEPRAKPAGSTAGAHQANPQAGLASGISPDSTDPTPPTRPAEESPTLASTARWKPKTVTGFVRVRNSLRWKPKTASSANTTLRLRVLRICQVRWQPKTASSANTTAEESPALTGAINLDSADWVSSMRPPEISPALVSAISLDSADSWVMRCDRVDFSPAAVAHPHTHPGPGIRRLLFGELTVTTAGATSTYRRGGAWFESGPDVVYAEASPTEETAFVRVILLPSEWAGKRTISYVDTAGNTAANTAVTKGRQRATILGEELLDPLAKA